MGKDLLRGSFGRRLTTPARLEVCRRLRARSDVAIIAVTARGEEADRVVALDEGADALASTGSGRVRPALRTDRDRS
ncbi:hypothetical protein [Streptomyces hirsutus]|uniref:hypothetical protein n=1 Tax=Streptomyces hirsutus TaxID=35620 RepID=UPI0006E2C1AB|nr:hypothetical protein [Streptomyces hirsutus]